MAEVGGHFSGMEIVSVPTIPRVLLLLILLVLSQNIQIAPLVVLLSGFEQRLLAVHGSHR